MEINLEEVEKIPEILKSVNELKELILSSGLIKEWYTLEDTWKVKGGCSLSTFKNNRFFQCKGGVPDGLVNGRRVWNKKSVEEWIMITDEKLPEYHQKYKTGAVRK